MITERNMDMELNDSGLDWLGEGRQGMSLMKGDVMDIGTFVDSLSDPKSFPDERANDLDIFLYDKETLPSDFTASVNNVSGRNMYPLGDSFLDYSSLQLSQDVETFASFDHQSYEELMSSPLSCHDLESVLNPDVTTNDLQAKPVQPCTDLPHQVSEDGLLASSVGLVKSDSDSSDAFSSSLGHSGIANTLSPSSSDSGTDSYYLDSSPSSTTGFSSQPGSPFSLEILPSPFPQPEILSDSPQPEKFQGKVKGSKSCRTKNNNRHSPYNSDSKSTESPSLPPSSPLPYDSTAGVEQQQLSKKERKRLQNKNAAIRYRQKMKAEAKVRLGEEEELLKENAKLKEKVEDLEREIRYVANLMEEVKKARSKSSQHC
ncbi:cyclic AMP-dependent transcription factor ATF-4 [Octopus vulgaris]|uniref:Cyclic AMP-dependent transcription factor ATF-4 n=1 Tax=Octopus vulgaris TaxID=6645 RepID=A0AA36F892_OCTVU|nr:cyclic AMP-dependent transcription factor ATF-4 [Octopus vulgaris]